MMNRRKRFVMVALMTLVLTVLVSTSAFAHICTNPNKQEGAGSVGTYNIVTGVFEPTAHVNQAMTNGGFVTFTDGATFWVDIYVHDVLPEGALESGPDGDNQCDGIGVDNFLACIGAVS